MSFAKSLQSTLGEHQPHEVDELILDELFTNIENFTEEHKKTLEAYDCLVHLSLNGLGLKSLANFPKLENLQILEVRDNKLDGSDFASLRSLFPNMYKIKVGGNPLASIDVLKAFAGSKLEKIEVAGTGLEKSANYRDEIFKMIPGLMIVDNSTKEGEAVETTVYDEGDDEFEAGEDDFEDEDFDDEDDEGFEDEDDEDFEEEEEESEKPKGKKSRH